MGLIDVDSATLLIWMLFRFVLGVGGAVAVVVGVIGVIGILRGKTALAGARDIDEFVKWHWNDADHAAAVIRTRVPLFSIALVSGLVGLSFGIFWRRFEAESLIGWCVALFVIAVWWWLEREFAWPGLLIPREARGTRGLFQARREARRQTMRSEWSGDEGARPDSEGGQSES